MAKLALRADWQSGRPPPGDIPFQSKPFWVLTELGCAALDKGTNQPNKFLDLYSSESALGLKYSNGIRDDLIQMQYLRAVYDYWGNMANNPLSMRIRAG
ncbi:MAG: glycoside hydrolase TIM-barrel-like domain-containing protein [Paracoccaceae bacterium]